MAKAKYSKTITRKYLLKAYVKDKRSTIDIAKEIGCAAKTISSYLVLHGIKIRTRSEVTTNIYSNLTPEYKNYDYLYRKYITEQQSASQIGNEIGYAPCTISKWLRNFNIPSRDYVESRYLVLMRKFGG